MTKAVVVIKLMFANDDNKNNAKYGNCLRKFKMELAHNLNRNINIVDSMKKFEYWSGLCTTVHHVTFLVRKM